MPDNSNTPLPRSPRQEKCHQSDAGQFKIGNPFPEDGSSTMRYALPEKVVKAVADIATNAWKARAKMVESGTGDVRGEMKRIYRHIEGMFDSFREMGLEIKDHTGDAFDYGLPLKVVTTQPTPGITKESVIETIKPTIYWQKQIIQMGEVVIATPA